MLLNTLFYDPLGSYSFLSSTLNICVEVHLRIKKKSKFSALASNWLPANQDPIHCENA
jgi:hypothetical protein